MDKYEGPMMWVKYASSYDGSTNDVNIEVFVMAAAMEYAKWLDTDKAKVDVIMDAYYAMRAMEFSSLASDAWSFEGPTFSVEADMDDKMEVENE